MIHVKDKTLGGVHWSFWAIGAAALLWNALGCMNFFSQMNAEAVAAMPESYRGIVESRPAWATGAFALAVFGGALGGLLLLLRKSAAYPVFVASLLGAVGTQIPFLFRIDEDEIEEFASTLIDAETQTDLTAIVERWGIRRSSPDFWPVLDSVTAYVKRTSPRRAGTFDINRYKNL